MRIIIESDERSGSTLNQANQLQSQLQSQQQSHGTTEAISAGPPAESLVRAIAEASAQSSQGAENRQDGTDAGAAPVELIEAASASSTSVGTDTQH